MACCPFVKNCGRWQLYATTKAEGVQYYRIYTNQCFLLGKDQVTCDVASAGSSDSSQMVIVCNNGGVVPLYKASSLEPVLVSQLPAGTSFDMVVKTENQIPQGIVLGY